MTEEKQSVERGHCHTGVREREFGDFSFITTRSRGKACTNPKRQRGMPQVSCGATPAPSLTLRVDMWDDARSGLGSASAGFPGGLQRGVSVKELEPKAFGHILLFRCHFLGVRNDKPLKTQRSPTRG